jgi:hypothetical protein
MADAPNCDARSDAPGAPSVDVVRPAELDGGANESGIEAPRKPRSEKQRAAFVKCREALARKKEPKPEPPEPPPELPAIPEVAPKKPRPKRERRTIHIPDPEPEPEPEPPKPAKPPPKQRAPTKPKQVHQPKPPPQALFCVV